MSDPNAPQEGLSAAQPPTGPQLPGSPGVPSGAPGAPEAPYPPPGAPEAPYPPPGAPYATPGAAPPAKKGRAGKIIAIVAGLVVLLLAVCGIGGYLLLDNLKDK